MTPKSKNALIPASNLPALYERMREAIAICYTVDDCKEIANQAAAIAAYYSQIKDDESVVKFLQVKIRAWRRIGEILVGANIDKSLCMTLKSPFKEGGFNLAEYIRRIRAAFKGNMVVKELSDGGMRQAIKLAELPRQFYDQNVGKHASIDSLVYSFSALQREEWQASPEGQAHLKEMRERQKATEKENALRLAAQIKAGKEQQRRLEQQAADIDELVQAQNEAFDEVGITLDRRDRDQMHKIVFLIKKSIYKILRQAAFDNKMTMQSILRSGLMMWFVAHGYTVPTDDLDLPRRDRPFHPLRKGGASDDRVDTATSTSA